LIKQRTEESLPNTQFAPEKAKAAGGLRRLASKAERNAALHDYYTASFQLFKD
jgi:hypothetical protein